MGRAKNNLAVDPLAKRADENHAQWQMRLALAGALGDGKKERRATPNPLTKAHGDYLDRFIFHHETGTTAKAHVNRGGTPVCRWKAAGKLTEGQQTTIDRMVALWDVAGQKARVTASYGERVAGSSDAESNAARVIDANEDLKRIKSEFVGLETWWFVFENVCRFDMPAGVAGAELGFGKEGNEARAHTIVCFVADIIATNEKWC